MGSGSITPAVLNLGTMEMSGQLQGLAALLDSTGWGIKISHILKKYKK